MAHKKAGGSVRNGRDLKQSAWASSVTVANWFAPATSLFANAAQRTTLAKTWASARTTRCSHWSMAMCSLPSRAL
jgi:hypothetical protein